MLMYCMRCESVVYFVCQGFDEYMNLVLDEAEEVHMKTKNRKTLGRMLFLLKLNMLALPLGVHHEPVTLYETHIL